jgi:hypothetical protein
MHANDERFVPHHFSVTREDFDSFRLEGWNEDGTGCLTVALTNASAIDAIAAISAALNA